MAQYLWYLLVLSIPFGTRTLVSGPAEFSEYASVFLYASDTMLVLFVLATLPELVKNMRTLSGRRTLSLFFLLAAVSLFAAPILNLGFEALKRLGLIIFAVVSARKLLAQERVKNITLGLIALLALFQSTIAIVQFTGQGQVGLKMLGESPISVVDPGTAKITVEGAKLIRAYGTMPDPNMLAGFLLIGLCVLAYIFLKTDRGLYVDAFDKARSMQANARAYISSPLLYIRILCSAAMFIVSLGLLFTFSRSGWASAALSMLVMLVLAARQSGRSAGRFLALLAIIIVALYYFFSPLILARTGLAADEPSVSYRVEYAKIGVSQLISNPLIGVGIGNQVQEAVLEGRYAAHGMTKSWESQPVHNFYLLIASEIGVVGALTFCWFLVLLFRQLIRDGNNPETIFVLAALAGLLFFGLFDHFLWDIQTGRLMFWLVIALALSHADRTESGSGIRADYRAV